ncbi:MULTISPECIES: hypothetical protein [unclassified Streptomyces]|uniref:hypothetical protein n=1 Tax=unclassified Streptomyces TaxID=2593676 RepID=UPI000DB8B03B|nr:MULTISPECIES: hypothetical protein [unclassified Streptomyces]PZT73796.1 hypothetical protein DNK55_16430 [Streptomyces sp. AC1-42T]PZT83207.1 hypothetical protein DNK56_14995 [Streptomyces sp. AC1-42W]
MSGQLVERLGFQPYQPLPGSDPATDGWPVGTMLDPGHVTYRLSDGAVEIGDRDGVLRWPAPAERTWRVIARSPLRRWINFVGIDGYDGEPVDHGLLLSAARAGRVVAGFVSPVAGP